MHLLYWKLALRWLYRNRPVPETSWAILLEYDGWRSLEVGTARACMSPASSYVFPGQSCPCCGMFFCREMLISRDRGTESERKTFATVTFHVNRFCAYFFLDLCVKIVEIAVTSVDVPLFTVPRFELSGHSHSVNTKGFALFTYYTWKKFPKC